MNPQGQQSSEQGYEQKDADVLGIAMIVALVLVLLAIGFLTAGGVLRYAERKRKPARVAMKEAGFPAPHLQAHPADDYQAFLRANEKELHSYGWVDSKTGAVRIPIERAMQLLLERGLPPVGAGQTRIQLMQARPSTDTQPKNPVGPPSS